MASSENLSSLIDSIFTNEDQIDPNNLRNFLRLLLTEVNRKSEIGSTPPPADEGNQMNKLTDLIAKCEARLEELMETPKTKVVIRNEGHKLESIVESIKNLKNINCVLQTQIAENTKAIKRLQKLQSTKTTTTFQDTAKHFQNNYINSDVCDFKRKLYEVENHVQELVVTSNSFNDKVENIHQKLINTSRIPEIEEKVQKLLDWRASLREDIEALTERYEYVKTVKISKYQIDSLIENKVNYNHLSKYVLQRNFTLAKEEFTKEVQELKELFCQLQIHITSKMVDLHKDVQKLFSALRSKRHIERRSMT